MVAEGVLPYMRCIVPCYAPSSMRIGYVYNALASAIHTHFFPLTSINDEVLPETLTPRFTEEGTFSVRGPKALEDSAADYSDGTNTSI